MLNVKQEILTTGTEAESARFMTRVYLWMTYGLAVTASISAIAFNSPEFMYSLISNPLLFWGLLILQLVEVIAFSIWVKKLGALGATMLFFIYCATVGTTFSVIFVIYTLTSIAYVFGATAAMFAGLTLFGLVTKKDLSPIGKIAFMGLLGLIAVQLVGLFWLDLSALDRIIAVSGIVIFSALTAADTQKIRNLNVLGNEGTDEDHVEAVSGALTLYLDFINIFLKMLRLFGKRR